MNAPNRIVHVINGLEFGGAERMLVKLMLAADRERTEPEVISLTTAGPLAAPLVNAGVPVTALGLSANLALPARTARLSTTLRKREPALVHTWLYKSDLIGGLAARAARVPVAWNLRQTNLDPASSTRSNRAAVRACAVLSSRIPAAISCVSSEVLDHHVRLGYDRDRMSVIPNGFDTDLFRPDPAARARVRAELGVPEDALIIGLVARLDPQKDHGTLLDAVVTLMTDPRIHVVLAGAGVDLDSIRRRAPVGLDLARIRAVGVVDDVAALTASFDIAVSSSAYGEGFTNALGEALSCGLCCVATDSGNARELVGTSGEVVPVRDAPALAAAIARVIDWGPDGRSSRGEEGRRRIEAAWSIASVASQYADFHEEVIERVRTDRVSRTGIGV